eukprot:748383-Hanusia_phi.AAC.1
MASLTLASNLPSCCEMLSHSTSSPFPPLSHRPRQGLQPLVVDLHRRHSHGQEENKFNAPHELLRCASRRAQQPATDLRSHPPNYFPFLPPTSLPFLLRCSHSQPPPLNPSPCA